MIARIAGILWFAFLAAGWGTHPAAAEAAGSSTSPSAATSAVAPSGATAPAPQATIRDPQSAIAPSPPTLAEALAEISRRFTLLDWAVVAAYLIFTTVLGAALAGRPATIRDFFLGGRKLPWIAVWGSIIATELSTATFLIVPAMVFKAGGNFTYLQLAIGTILARILIGIFFVPAFYEREIYSPYEYMGNRLGPRVRKLTTLLFMIGAVLGQGVRVYIAALAFQVVTGKDIRMSIVLMMVFAVLWTWLGGIRTVIWTDFIQFILFVVGAVLALMYISSAVEGGLLQVFRESHAAGKLRLIDTTLDTQKAYTLWCGLLATVWLTLASHGTDQLNAQRMFTCRTAGDARKAIIASSASQLIVLALLVIGAGLYVYYQHHPLTPAEQVVVADRADQIFAVFIVDVLPRGISGLVMAAVFAAAISTIDSVLAALAQTTLSNLPTGLTRRLVAPGREVPASRILVVFWGVALALFAFSCETLKQRYGDLIQFALAVTAYTYGPLLGTFLLAFLPTRRNDLGLVWGVPLAMLAVFSLEHHAGAALWIVPVAAAVLAATAFVRFRRQWGKAAVVAAVAATIVLVQWVVGRRVPAAQPILVWPWHYPIGTLITFIVGYWAGERDSAHNDSSRSN
ncbi:MAG: sodium/solute symporter [Candidatus Sumerlaeia bacterium]|nr:sodium/solute symporter [Candidatus Sumerlaeia bacterium]